MTALFILASDCFAKDLSDKELAIQLSNSDSRRSAVAYVVSHAERKVPLLLKWTQKPPPNLLPHSLYVGVADVFGQLKIIEAIPFLIKWIDMEREPIRTTKPWISVWTESAEVIKKEKPAIAALIRMGPSASDRLIEAYDDYHQRLSFEDRVAIVFVVSQIQSPKTLDFLQRVNRRATELLRWTETGEAKK